MVEYLIGIDLGTTYSCLAYIDADGQVKIQKNNMGEDTTASAIVFDDDGQVAVGTTAKNQADMYPDSFVDMVKRDMGCVDRDRVINGETYTPSQLSAIILKSMIENFSMDHDCDVSRAVISVPAYFGNSEKEATILAGRLAGLKDVQLIAEPVAASIAYGILETTNGATEEGSSKKNIIVYDLGGGTFDATVLEIDGKNYTTKSVDGDKYLGGKDWDSRLIELIIQKILEANPDLSEESIVNDPAIRTTLKMDAERYKKDLTNLAKIKGTLNVNSSIAKFEVTKEDFELSTQDLLDKTISISKTAIEKSGLTIEEIDSIILVGGSSRMPQVKNAIEQTFPGKEYRLFDPDQCVAKGAALYSASHFIRIEPKPVGPDNVVEERDFVIPTGGVTEVNITTVLPKTFGVKARDAKTNKELVGNIIYRNTPLPVERKQKFGVVGDSTILPIYVYENDSYDSKTSELEESNEIGQFDVELEKGMSSNGSVEVTMNATADGRLVCSAIWNGVTRSFDLKFEGLTMTQEEIDAQSAKIGELIFT